MCICSVTPVYINCTVVLIQRYNHYTCKCVLFVFQVDVYAKPEKLADAKEDEEAAGGRPYISQNKNKQVNDFFFLQDINDLKASYNLQLTTTNVLHVKHTFFLILSHRLLLLIEMNILKLQVEEMENVTEDEKSGSVLKIIGHDGHIIEQTLGEETVHITGVSSDVLFTPIKSPCKIVTLNRLSYYEYVYCCVDQ